MSSIPPWFSWEFSPEPQVVGESCWQLVALIITSQSQSISALPASTSLQLPPSLQGLFTFGGRFAASGGLQKADVVGVQRPCCGRRDRGAPEPCQGVGTAKPPRPPSTALGSSGHATN